MNKDFASQKKLLTELQYEVTQKNATERPFTGEYDDFYQEGIYVDVVSGEALFSSKDKYDAGCGWPAFSKPITRQGIKERADFSHGMHRVEVRSQTRCLETQGDIVSVSALLGHSSTKMTLDVYADTLIEQRVMVVNQMEKALNY